MSIHSLLILVPRSGCPEALGPMSRPRATASSTVTGRLPPAVEGQPVRGSANRDRSGSRDWLGRVPGVSPPFVFQIVPGAAGAVQGVQSREFLAGQLEVEDPARSPRSCPGGLEQNGHRRLV